MPTTFLGLQPVRLSLHWHLGDQAAQIDLLLNAANGTPGSAWSSEDYWTAFDALFVPSFLRAVVSNDAFYLGAKMYSKFSILPPQVEKNPIGSGPGTGGAGYIPTQNSGLIQWHSGLGGKRGRGRSYMPFPATLDTSPTGLTSTDYRLRMSQVADIFVTPFNLFNVGAGGGTMDVGPCTSYTLPPSGVPYRLNSYTIANGFATQRRRGYFGRPNFPGF